MRIGYNVLQRAGDQIFCQKNKKTIISMGFLDAG